MNRKERRAEKKQGAPGPQVPSPAVAALLAQALRHHQAGALTAAEQIYRQILAITPHQADALHLLGVIAHQSGRNDVAVETIGKAIAENDGAATYHCSLGHVFRAQGRLEEAAAAYQRALSLKADYAEASRNLGTIFEAQGRRDDAIAAFRRTIALNPAYADAHMNLAMALQAAGDLDGAAAAFRATLRLKPDAFEAQTNLGNIEQVQGRLTEAVASYQKALALKPHSAEVYNNLGTALRDLCRVDDAIAAYRRALVLRPSLAEAHSNLLMTLHYAPGYTNADLLNESRAFGHSFEPTSALAAARPASGATGQRLRIGYVSGDFHYHPVGFFLTRVLAAHDRSQFEIFCYSNSTVVDAMTDRLRATSDHWSEIAGLSDAEAAALIRGHGIDLLIDLSGHTARNRLTLFALRPAPVQASWLGYFGTTGLGAIDYILMDKTSVPPDGEAFYSENVIRLPYLRFCYEAPDDLPQPAAPPSIARGHVTFGSFNNIAKINADVIGLWADVLHAVPQSRLVLKWKSFADATCRAELTQAFAAHGITSDRIELRGASPHRAMLAEYADIDIALDPFPFGGGLTTCEALWMGVPVITLPGERPASRQSLGYLQCLGLEALAAASPTDYIAQAAMLAADQPRLRELRQSLRSRFAASPICDGPLFTKALEEAFEQMARQTHSGSLDIATTEAAPTPRVKWARG